MALVWQRWDYKPLGKVFQNLAVDSSTPSFRHHIRAVEKVPF